MKFEVFLKKVLCKCRVVNHVAGQGIVLKVARVSEHARVRVVFHVSVRHAHGRVHVVLRLGTRPAGDLVRLVFHAVALLARGLVHVFMRMTGRDVVFAISPGAERKDVPVIFLDLPATKRNIVGRVSIQ